MALSLVTGFIRGSRSPAKYDSPEEVQLGGQKGPFVGPIRETHSP